MEHWARILADSPRPPECPVPHVPFLLRDESDDAPTREGYWGQAAWLVLRVVDQLTVDPSGALNPEAFQYLCETARNYVREIPEDPDGEGPNLTALLDKAAPLRTDWNDLSLRRMINSLTAYAHRRRDLGYDDEAADLFATILALSTRRTQAVL